MLEKQNVYDNIYEQVNAENKQKLSTLQQKIKDDINDSTLNVVGNIIMGEKAAESGKITANELMGVLFAERTSKDVIADALAPKNAKKWFLHNLLKKTKEPLAKKFEWELDELKKVIVIPGEGTETTPPLAQHDHTEEENTANDEDDYDNLEGWDKYGEAKEFAFNVPMGLPIAGITKKDITSHQWHRHAPKEWASTDHKGIDFRVATGTELLAPGDGKVITVADQPKGAGKYIEIDHGDHITRYFHLDKQGVKVGDIVKKGEVIGKTGNSGNSTGAHLHYEIRSKKDIVYKDKKWTGKFEVLDPEKYIDFDGDGKIDAAA